MENTNKSRGPAAPIFPFQIHTEEEGTAHCRADVIADVK
jgi:hypothetical protein